MPQNIVVINFTRMGDILQSGPLLRKIARENRNCKITLIVQKGFAEIADGLPMVDKVISVDTDKLLYHLESKAINISKAAEMLNELLSQNELQNVDLLVNLSHTPLSATLCHIINAKYFIGLYRNSNGRFEVSNQWVNYLFTLMSQRNSNPFNLVEIFMKFYPGINSNLELEYKLTDEDRVQAQNILRSNGADLETKYIVLQLGASTENRRWPVNKFAKLSEILVNSGYQVVLVGTESENSLAVDLLNQAREPVISLVGKTSVKNLAGVLSNAEKLVSNDTGTIHLAAALKIPTIGIYLGPASAKDTAPFANNHIVLEADIDCAPCSYQNKLCSNYCRDTISEHHVYQLIKSSYNDLFVTAKKINGARVYLTEITESGEFALKRLNTPKTCYDENQLIKSRNFWDYLLGEEALQQKNSEYNYSENCGYDQLKDLQEINSRLTAIYANVLNELKFQKVSSQRVSQSVEERNSVFSRFSELTESQDIISSFAQFMLVRNSTVPTSSLESFLLHFEEDVKLLNRAAELFCTINISNNINNNEFVEV